MVAGNNAIAKNHFRKKWATRVKTWLQQPIQKKIRRQKRKEKAAAIAPRPAAGPLRPYVHCQTVKYNSKSRLGRGFTLDELKGAGINAKFAKTVGIAVDHRRENKSEESLQLNIQRLKEYKERLIVFPRKGNKPRKGDASKDDIAQAKQLTGTIVAAPKPEPAVTFANLTDDMKKNNVHYQLRHARNEARLSGPRIRKARELEEENKNK
eukprot:TRINITY_DN107812_c0_g1_i1.p1 TRINITY_DN107812_c0_g1~~TRINITY_DN107812_c0_g1_i1.p1  ORF type:complete len:209 (+),score=17.60 TRINITY_DN107812_c0_g1_i1:60-686(+)